MGRRLSEMTYVIVGFRVDRERSVYYKKCKNLAELKRALEVAFRDKRSDFVSIRRIRGREEEADYSLDEFS